MKRIRQIMVTTHVDLHGDRFAPEAIDDMLRHLRRLVLPVGVQHDPRIPPIGRILGGEVQTLDDGALALVGDIEMFESGDEPAYLGGDREMPIHWRPAGEFSMEFDRNFRDEKDQADIAALANILRVEPQERFKKSLDPMAVLLVGLGCFAAAEIAKGFLAPLGKDAYEALKATLQRILSRKKQGEAEKLLVVSYAVTDANVRYEVQLILTNPDEHAIESALDTGGAAIAEMVGRVPIREARIQQLVFEYAEGRPRLLFAVRRDAVPLRMRPRGPSEERSSDA